MPFPPVPRENQYVDLVSLAENVKALYVYLERLRQNSFDEVTSIVNSDPNLQGPVGPIGPQGVQGIQGIPGLDQEAVLNRISFRA